MGTEETHNESEQATNGASPVAKRIGVETLVAANLRRQKRIERFTFGFALSFVIGIVALVILTDNQVAEGAGQVFRMLGGAEGNSANRNRVLDCQKEKNARSPYCQEHKAMIEGTWRSITRFGDTPNAFSLHE